MPLFAFKGGQDVKYTYDIASEYREDLKRLSKEKFARDRERAFLKEVEDLSNEGIERMSEVEAEISLISGMISSTEYALFWIESGHERMAGEKRPITNQSKKKRTQLWGNIEHSQYLSYEAPRELTREELELIDDMMRALSEREREVYLSVYGKGNTQEQTGEYLGIQTGTVKKYLDRARAKIDRELKYGSQGSLVI